MSKNEFLNQLFELLSDLSPEERDEAIAYYREYIEDAGFENEETILRELGTPQVVAAEIKSGMMSKNNQDINYSSGQVNDSPESYSNINFSKEQNGQTSAPKGQSNTALVILAVIGVILLSPVWLGLLSGLFGIVVGFFAALIGVIFGFGAAGLACMLGGIVVFIIGFPTMLHSPLAGVTCIGIGLIITALGILFLLLTGWICLVVIPWAIRGISNLFHRFSNRNKEAHV